MKKLDGRYYDYAVNRMRTSSSSKQSVDARKGKMYCVFASKLHHILLTLSDKKDLK